MSQSRYIVIPFSDLEDELRGWLDNIDDALNIPDSMIFDLLLNYYHDHRQVLLNRHEIFEQKETLCSYVRTWLAHHFGDITKIELIEDDTEQKLVVSQTVSQFEHAMGIIYQRFYTVLRYFYHHYPTDPALEFLKWVGGDVMLVRATPKKPQTYRLTGAFTGGDRYG